MHLALCVSLKDVRGTDQVQLFLRALAAADVAARGLKRERVTRYPCVAANEHNVNGTKFQLHPRFRTEILTGAPHRAKPPGFSPPHCNLEDRTSRGVIRVQKFFRFRQKRGPEKLDRFAYLFVRDLFQGTLACSAPHRYSLA